MFSKRFYGAALMAAIVLPAVLEGCSSSSPLCCTEFQAGATLDANIGGDAKAQVAVQAIADFAGVADAAIDDLTTACRGIATDLGATQEQADTNNGAAGKQAQMKAWCDTAVQLIGTVKGSATVTINAKPPACEASVSAKADCSAKCSGGVKCDVKANPPTCEGGKLEVSCSGKCTASGSASVSCTGSCSGKCSGSCSAEGGVECNGKCDGTCTASGGGSGSGFDAQGNCTGTCKGTCSVTKPGVTCTGSCKGTCDAACTGTATAKAECDGTCDVGGEPIKCTGGTLKGGCQVQDPQCSANCDASVSAKAQCTPPSIDITFSGGADAAAIGKLVATLKANFGVVLEFKSRLELMAKLTGTIGANADAVASIKAACIPPVIAAAGDAVGNVTAAGTATASLAGSVGGS